MSEISGIGCDEVLVEIEDYLHGELDPERSADFAEHLAECGPCLQRAEFQRKLKQIIRTKCSSEPTAPPEHLILRIKTVIRSERWTVEGSE